MAPISIETGIGTPPIVLNGHIKDATIATGKGDMHVHWDELSKQTSLTYEPAGKLHVLELDIGQSTNIPTKNKHTIGSTELAETITVTRLPDEFEE